VLSLPPPPLPSFSFCLRQICSDSPYRMPLDGAATRGRLHSFSRGKGREEERKRRGCVSGVRLFSVRLMLPAMEVCFERLMDCWCCCCCCCFAVTRETEALHVCLTARRKKAFLRAFTCTEGQSGCFVCRVEEAACVEAKGHHRCCACWNLTHFFPSNNLNGYATQ
jgi:hypothetical protein